MSHTVGSIRPGTGVGPGRPPDDLTEGTEATVCATGRLTAHTRKISMPAAQHAWCYLCNALALVGDGDDDESQAVAEPDCRLEAL